jgi:hypothetical protein
MENPTPAPDPISQPPNNTPKQYFSIYTLIPIQDMVVMH